MKYDLDRFDDKNKQSNPKTTVDKRTAKNKETKKSNKKIALYISVSVLLVLVVSIVILIMNSGSHSNTETTWLHKSENGNEYYYTFNGNDEGGKLDITIGTDHYLCSYTYSEEGKLVTSYINGEIYPDNLLGTFSYSISEENGTDVMKLISYDLTEVKLKKVEKPDESKFIKPYDNYVVDDSIVGNWELDYKIGKLRLDIRDDGTLSLNLLNAEIQNYVYTTVDSKIKMSYYKDTLLEFEEAYKLKDGKLMFLGNMWEKSE